MSAKQLSNRFIPSDDQTANILTKALTYGRFHYLRCKLNVLPGSFSLTGDVRVMMMKTQSMVVKHDTVLKHAKFSGSVCSLVKSL